MALIEPCTNCAGCFEAAWRLETARKDYQRASDALHDMRRVQAPYSTFAPPPPHVRRMELYVGACLNNIGYYQGRRMAHQARCDACVS